MPCVASKLVLHPSTTSVMDAAVDVGGVAVAVGVDVAACAVNVSVVNGVTLGVSVLTFGVGEAVKTPITTGVAVKTDGCCVNGKNGVGGLPGKGWMIQPLHDASKSAIKMKGVTRFILSPRLHCIPVDG